MEEKLKTEIQAEIDEAVNTIFLNHQKEMGIEYGDIMFLDAIRLTEAQDNLANIIAEVLISEKGEDDEQV